MNIGEDRPEACVRVFVRGQRSEWTERSNGGLVLKAGMGVEERKRGREREVCRIIS